MEPIVIAALISGTAVITAATIQAAGNIVAAKKRLAENPPTKDMAQEVITDHRIKKVDWWFWGILAFMAFWWVLTMATADVMGSRYTMALVILTPPAAAFMAMAKVLKMIMANRRR
jgi:hypothetical protein